jgi:medium-chain acyl-[acyl-carrier-protein] hydrolase
VVETWPSGVEKLFAVRDFRVMNSRGEVIGAASTYWLIVDVESHRPLRPKAELETYGSIAYGDPVFGTSMEKIGIPDEMHELDKHRVSFSDLDIVGHTNNVKYMEWCINTAVSAGSHGFEIRDFEINFMKETILGDVVTIYGESTPPALFNAIRKEDEVEVFRVKINFAVPSEDQDEASS